MKTIMNVFKFNFLLSILFISCNNNENTAYDDLPIIVENCNGYNIIPNNYSEYIIPYYEFDSMFLGIFDKVIEDEKKCPCYDPLLTAFGIWNRGGVTNKNITIYTINLFCHFYDEVYGVFKYEGYYFFLEGEKLDFFNEQRYKSLKINSLIPINEYNFIDINSAWHYYLTENKQIKFDGHFECPPNNFKAVNPFTTN